ncbi:TonB-dependent receptor [uncultured Sphingomonas sp.]|uniref:TonB-dependent receptor n=1 Tax=uncultured Sphingomonas sp. TaxID=158754 RepID=UPI002595C8C4|nr:TonB-dependent receptor [uncultured Sphingomonas sp.]
MTERHGSWRARRRRRVDAHVAGIVPLLLSLVLPFLPSPAAAAPPRETSIVLAPSTLDRALLDLGRQTGIEIISTEHGLNAVRTHAVTGLLPVRVALDRLLAGTGFRAEPIRGGGFRVVRQRTPTRRAPARRPAPPAERSQGSDSNGADIIVTASKQAIPLLRYPGSIAFSIGTPRLPNGAVGEVTDLSRTLPVIQSTQLGPGRNKLFIRGIADSSFSGTTQSTASVYLDDVQLNASGADPGLRLYDMRSVEVMEGPQGTLYGAGAIGGVVRLTSNAPDPRRVAGSVTAGAVMTAHGDNGGDLAAMLNLPVAENAAIRGVAYTARDGGYIDDSRRHRRDTNDTFVSGGRLAARWQTQSGWRVDASGATQHIVSRDGQYAEPVVGPLAHAAAIAQPFDSSFLFGRLVISHDWASGLSLVSATGVARLETADTFDATPYARVPPPPVAYRTDMDKLLVSHESRLSRSFASGASWLIGVSLISDKSILSRKFEYVGREADVIGVSNVTRQASVFGEATFVLDPALSVTAGLRATAARVDGEPSSTPRGGYIRGRSTQRLDPTVALSYRLGARLAAFARFQTGFRTGGLAVAQGVGRVANYKPDSILLGEFGLRRLRSGATGLAFAASASTAWWRDIQADLINRRGAPYTDNIGNASIYTVEATADWIPVAGLDLTGALLFTENRVSGPVADQSKRDNRRLPDTPPLAGNAAITYAWNRTAAWQPRVGATIAYVGRSVLGTGDLLDVSQGRYWSLGASAGVRWRNLDWRLGVDNLTDTAVSRFAYGNPFRLAMRDQTTPPRPLNVRLGVTAAW